jgi:dolichyl-phosphate beta-glucosyltransferase
MDSLSIVVPAFNEARRLPALFEGLDADADRAAQAADLSVLEVIVVDDGSTDETPSLLAERERTDPRLRVIRYEPNRGKGAAVRRGALEAAGDFVLVTDVDLSTPLADVVGLSSALRGGSDVAIGSRGLPTSRIGVHQPFHRELMGKTFNGLLRLLTGLPYRDTQCGFKLFRLEAARILFEVQRIDGFAFDAELCLNARRLGMRVSEVPVAWYDQRDTKVKLLRSSLQMGLDLLRIVLLARRPLPPGTERPASAEAQHSRSVSAGR